MIAQFQGEDRREAIINHLSLDIEEEYTFFAFLEAMGYSEYSDDDIIEAMHNIFIEKFYKH